MEEVIVVLFEQWEYRYLRSVINISDNSEIIDSWNWCLTQIVKQLTVGINSHVQIFKYLTVISFGRTQIVRQVIIGNLRHTQIVTQLKVRIFHNQIMKLTVDNVHHIHIHKSSAWGWLFPLSSVLCTPSHLQTSMVRGLASGCNWGLQFAILFQAMDIQFAWKVTFKLKQIFY